MSANKLLEMINHDVKSLFLKIELAAFVEVLFPFWNFCYAMEGDGDLAFVAGERIDNLFLIYPDGNLPDTPSANQLIRKAVEFIHGSRYERAQNVPMPQNRTAAEVAAGVPRPPRVAQAVRAAILAHETDAQQQQRQAAEALELARAALEQARLAAEYKQAQEDAINAEADRQGDFPPQNEAEWKAHLAAGLKPAIDYLLKRFSAGGDRYNAVEFYRGARVSIDQ